MVDFRKGLGSETMSIGDVAAFLAVSPETVKDLLQEGQIEGYRIAKKIVRIHTASVERYAAEQKAAPPYDDKLQARLRKHRREASAKRQSQRAEQLQLKM